jgi:hypothetical protein
MRLPWGVQAGISIWIVVAGTGCSRGAPVPKPSLSIDLKPSGREFPFLAPREAAIDVALWNPSDKVLIIDLRPDGIRARGESVRSPRGIVQPKKLIDGLTFRCAGQDIPLEKELRMSDVRRRRNQIEEGAIFEALDDFQLVEPRGGVGIGAIVWAKAADNAKGFACREIDVTFEGWALAADAGKAEIARSPIGQALKNKEPFLAATFERVSVTARVPLGR